MIRIEKTAYEELFRYHEFLRRDQKGWLASGETISSADVTASGTGLTISDISIYNNTAVKFKISAGNAGTVYVVSVKIVSSSTQKFEDKIEISIKQ